MLVSPSLTEVINLNHGSNAIFALAHGGNGTLWAGSGFLLFTLKPRRSFTTGNRGGMRYTVLVFHKIIHIMILLHFMFLFSL